jgi:uncharacterized coiled-coil protein SlyX
MADHHERFIALEERYAHQARLLEELNVELSGAYTRIEELAKEVKSLREMIGSLAPPMETSPDE